MDSAVKTSDLVSSLFPKAVRDRVLTEKQTTGQAAAAAAQRKRHKDDYEESLQAFLTKSTMDMSLDDVSDDDDFMFKTKPIADLYPRATVMVSACASAQPLNSRHDPLVLTQHSLIGHLWIVLHQTVL